MDATLRDDYDDYTEKKEPIRTTINTIRAHTMDDAKTAGRSVADGNAVLLNIKEMDQNTLSRVLDYLTGYTDCCQGRVAHVAHDLLMICPYSVTLTGDSISSSFGDPSPSNAFSFDWERK